MYGGTIRFAFGKPSRCQTILARSHLAQAKSIIINGIVTRCGILPKTPEQLLGFTIGGLDCLTTLHYHRL